MPERHRDRAGRSPAMLLGGPVLAHQGGWDEILLVLAPLLVIALLLWVANKRANKRLGPPPEG